MTTKPFLQVCSGNGKTLSNKPQQNSNNDLLVHHGTICFFAVQKQTQHKLNGRPSCPCIPHPAVSENWVDSTWTATVLKNTSFTPRPPDSGPGVWCLFRSDTVAARRTPPLMRLGILVTLLPGSVLLGLAIGKKSLVSVDWYKIPGIYVEA